MTDDEKVKFLRKMGYGSGLGFTKPTNFSGVLAEDVSGVKEVIDLKTGKKTTQRLRGEGEDGKKEKKDTRVEISDLRMLARIFDVKKEPEKPEKKKKSFEDELGEIEKSKS